MPRFTAVGALTVIVPLLPLPFVEAKISAPLATVKVEVSRVMFPAFPVPAVEVESWVCWMSKFLLVISMSPALPVPWVSVDRVPCP